MKPFTVIEIQHNQNGTSDVLHDEFENLNDAYNKYYYALSFAAVSTLPCHSCTLLDEAGHEIESKCFYHQQPEPEES